DGGAHGSLARGARHEHSDGADRTGHATDERSFSGGGAPCFGRPRRRHDARWVSAHDDHDLSGNDQPDSGEAMSITTRRRRRGGWILLMVLLILLALALPVAGYYTQSEDHMFTGQAMGAYTMASTRAERGAQEAILQLRSGVANTLTITALCDDKL